MRLNSIFKTCCSFLAVLLPALLSAQSDCHNVLTSGLICCNQTVCIGDTPLIINETEAPAGGEGQIEYAWLRLHQIMDNAPYWEVIPGAVGAEYQPPTLSATSYFLRDTRRQECVNWLASNIVTITVVPEEDPACASSTSANEPGLAAVRCFPNPFEERIEVYNIDHQPIRIQALNVVGVTFATVSVKPGEQIELNTHTWPAGVYTLRLENADGKKNIRSFVKL